MLLVPCTNTVEMAWIEIEDRSVREEVRARIDLDPMAFTAASGPSLKWSGRAVILAFIAGILLGWMLRNYDLSLQWDPATEGLGRLPDDSPFIRGPFD